MEDSLPWTPINRRAKFDATSFILGREIRKCTHTHIHTKLQQQQTVNHISTPCLSACVDNNRLEQKGSAMQKKILPVN